MERVRIYRLHNLRPSLANRIGEARMEAARVWTLCRDPHLQARQQHLPWPTRDDPRKATKGQFSLHSQTVQMICHTFLGNVETTRQVKQRNPRMRYPYKDKRHFPLPWPAQAVSAEAGRVVLPMGRGRPSLVLPVHLSDGAGACKRVWQNGYELHVTLPYTPPVNQPGSTRAAVDLGEIHLAAVATDTGAALVVSGRGIRTLKRRWNTAHREIVIKRPRCQQGSKRWRRLLAAHQKMSARIRRQVRDLRHKGTRKVVAFCEAQAVGKFYVDDPDGVRARSMGRHHNQRMSQWEYGKDIEYLTRKCTQRHIECFTGTERGTSSRCPACGAYQRPKGRVWPCRRCGFTGHRDDFGSVNMHVLTFGRAVSFPSKITYLQAGPIRVPRRHEHPPEIARAGTL